MVHEALRRAAMSDTRLSVDLIRMAPNGDR